MMAVTPRTPLRRQTAGPLDKADPALEVDVTVDNEPVRFITITPSQVPDGAGVWHTVGINEASPVLDIVSAAAYTIEMSDYPHLSDNNLPRSVWLHAGKDGTSFDVLSML